MNLRTALRRGALRLQAAGVPDPDIDAALLLGSVVCMGRLQVLAQGYLALTDDQQAAFDDLLARRAGREPLQYILGSTGFMGHDFLCRPGVLIPRPDTETLCLQGLERLQPGQRALDLCCGSGAVGISLKLAEPSAQVWLSDIADGALALSRENARRLQANVNLVQGDLFAAVTGAFDLICCNPPYIPTGQLPRLQQEVQREPALALDGGQDGLYFYRRIVKEAPAYLTPRGWLLLELGDGQDKVLQAMAQVDFDTISVYDDLSGLPRVLAARRKENHAVP